MDFTRIKSLLFTGIAVFLVFSFMRSCFSCGSSSSEEVELPTQGLITTVVEVEKDAFKIEDETTIPDTAASLIIAKYLDGKIDTFTLQEARLVQQGGGHSGNSMMGPIVAAAGAGMLGYMMGRSMRTPPSPSAYTNQQTYNRVNSTTGSSLRNTAARTSRPSTGRSSSGFGGGRSSRGFGG
jgi:hypothetical protein